MSKLNLLKNACLLSLENSLINLSNVKEENVFVKSINIFPNNSQFEWDGEAVKNIVNENKDEKTIKTFYSLYFSDFTISTPNNVQILISENNLFKWVPISTINSQTQIYTIAFNNVLSLMNLNKIEMKKIPNFQLISLELEKNKPIILINDNPLGRYSLGIIIKIME